MIPARKVACGKWPGILGRWLDERALAGRHTACPMCGGKDRFRMDDKEGAGTWICSNCGAGDGFHLLEQINGWTFQQAAEYVERECKKLPRKDVKPGRSPDAVRASLRKVWGASKRIEPGDPVWRYLAGRCGMEAGPAGVRFHPALPYVDDDGVVTLHPAMVAQVLGSDGEPLTIHRTYLTEEGEKAAVMTPRKLMTPTRKLENVAVRLAPVVDGWLGVGEGLETCLAASKRHSIPVWACCSAGLLKSFCPPPDVKLLCIFGDNDRTFTGQAAAYDLARAVANIGVECKVFIPEVEGTDWADYGKLQ